MAERFVGLTLDNGENSRVYVNPRNVTYILPHKAENAPDGAMVGSSVYFVTSAWWCDPTGIYTDHEDVLESPGKVASMLEGGLL